MFSGQLFAILAMFSYMSIQAIKINNPNINCDKTLIVIKLKWWQNSKCDKTQNVTKLKNSNCDKTKKSNCDKTQKLKLCPNNNYDISQFLTKDILEWSVSKNILTPWQAMRCSLGSFLRFSQCFHTCPFKLSKSTIQILPISRFQKSNRSNKKSGEAL